MIERRRLLTALGTVGALSCLTAVRAQTAWAPTRPVTLVVPWPAGAPSDAFARRLQPVFQRLLGQPVLVENLGGAGGSLGVARAMAQPADGHTLLVGTPTELVLSPLTLPGVRYTPQDFGLLAHFGRVGYVLCCRAGLPQASLADIVALRGGSAAPLSIGNIGPGSLIHLMSLQFEKQAGLALTHIPYRGVPPMVQDLMGGQLDLGFLPLAGHTVATLEQGKLRALGVSTVRRAPLFPQLPTLAERHPALAGFDVDVWGGLLVRSDTPAAVQQRLYEVYAEAVREPGFVEWARATGSDPVPVLPLAEAQAFYPREVERYTTLLRGFPKAATN